MHLVKFWERPLWVFDAVLYGSPDWPSYSILIVDQSTDWQAVYAMWQ
jgi:hypothetical protein